MTGRGAEPFADDTLRTDGTTRMQKLRATTAVMRRVPEGRYRNEILAALFQPARSAPPHGNKGTPAIYEARQAWLKRCRAWIREQGREPAGSQIRKTDQREYEAATGDVWQGGAR